MSRLLTGALHDRDEWLTRNFIPFCIFFLLFKAFIPNHLQALDTICNDKTIYLALQTHSKWCPLAGPGRGKEQRTENGQVGRKTGETGDWNSLSKVPSKVKPKYTVVSVISTNVLCVHKSCYRDGHRKLLSFDIQIIFKEKKKSLCFPVPLAFPHILAPLFPLLLLFWLLFLSSPTEQDFNVVLFEGWWAKALLWVSGTMAVFCSDEFSRVHYWIRSSLFLIFSSSFFVQLESGQSI